jgi:hypothetical protein
MNLLKQLQALLPAPRRHRFHRRAEALPLRRAEARAMRATEKRHDGSPAPRGGTAAHQDLDVKEVQGSVEAGKSCVLHLWGCKTIIIIVIIIVIVMIIIAIIIVIIIINYCIIST